MRRKYNYIRWYINQLFSLIKALLLVKPKNIIIKNFLKLVRQQAYIKVGLKSINFIMRDFYDLLAFYEVFINKSYQRLFTQLGAEPITFIDIGAYNGDSSIFASQHRNVKKIISIEPHPNNFEILKKNLKLNGVKSVELNKAVANTDKVTMYIYKNRRQTGILMNGVNRKKFIIGAISLKKIVNQAKGDIVVKCDTEGAEFGIFLNTPISVLRKVARVMIEYHMTDDLTRLIFYIEKSGMSVIIRKNRFLNGFGYIYGFR